MARQLYKPTGQMNGVLCIMRGLDFGLVEADYTIADNGTLDLVVETPVPMKVRAFVKLTSGEVTLDIDVNNTGVFAAGDAVQKTITTTDETDTVANTSSSNRFAVVRLTESQAGVNTAVIDQLWVEVSGMLPEGEDWTTVRYSHNALVGQTVSGLYTADFND